jgi:mitotic spindle assembly checkpoint protein MAD1
LEEEVSQFKLLAEERSQTIDEIQVQFQELSSAPENKAAEQENNDMAVVREELHRQAAYLRALESTNVKLTSELAVLRDRHTSIEVLREEKRGLERKLQPLEGLREKVVKLEAQVEAGRQERETWCVRSGYDVFVQCSNHTTIQGPESAVRRYLYLPTLEDAGGCYPRPLCTSP